MYVGNLELIKVAQGWELKPKSTLLAQRVKSVGKNLFDAKAFVENGKAYYSLINGEIIVNAIDARDERYNLLWVKLKPNTQYIIKTTNLVKFRVYRKNGYPNVVNSDLSTTALFTTDSSVFYGFKFVYTDTLPYNVGLCQLEEGDTATEYEPYQESITYLQSKDENGDIEEAKRLPNGVSDRVYQDGGKWYKEQNIGVYKSDNYNIYSLVTTGQNVDRVVITLPSDYYDYGVQVSIYGRVSCDFATVNNENSGLDDISLIGSIGRSGTSTISYYVAKGTYADVSEAQTDLIGTSIIYQLATPITTEIQADGVLQAYTNGTIDITHYCKDEITYISANGGLVFNKPITTIDKIKKLVDGKLVEIAFTPTLASDGKSATVTALNDNDVVLAYAPIDTAESTIPTTEHTVGMNTKAQIFSNTAMTQANTRHIELIEDTMSTLHEALDPVTESIEYTVGASGDYTTINEALHELTKLVIDGVGAPPSVTLKLLTGFVLNESIVVYNKDLSWITIVSEDAEVTANSIAFNIASPEDYNQAFLVINGKLPTIGTLFVMDNTGNAWCDGFTCYDNGFVKILPGAGFKNAGGAAIYLVNASSAVADGAIFTGANYAGAYVTLGSTLTAKQANFDDSLDYGINVENQSTICAIEATANNAGGHAVYIEGGSKANLESVVANGANDYGMLVLGSSVVAPNATFNDCGSGVCAEDSSTIHLYGVTVNNAGGRAVQAAVNSTISMHDSYIDNAGSYGIIAYEGSSIDAKYAEVTGSGSSGVVASYGSKINIDSGVSKDSAGLNLQAEVGSSITAPFITATGATESGVYASTGSYIDVSWADLSNATINCIVAEDNSKVSAPHATCLTAGANALKCVDNSIIVANNATFSNSVQGGLLAINHSTIIANDSTGTGAGGTAVKAENCSTVTVTNTVLSNASSVGLHAVSGSTISADGIDVSGAGSSCIMAEAGSKITAVGADCSNAGQNGVLADGASTINIESATCTGAAVNGIYAKNNSIINAVSSYSGEAGSAGIRAEYGGKIVADNSQAFSCTEYGIYASTGGTVIAPTFYALYAGINGVYCSAGNVIFDDGVAYKVDDVEDNADIVLSYGATIHARGALGGSATTINTLTADGTLYK